MSPVSPSGFFRIVYTFGTGWENEEKNHDRPVREDIRSGPRPVSQGFGRDLRRPYRPRGVVRFPRKGRCASGFPITTLPCSRNRFRAGGRNRAGSRIRASPSSIMAALSSTRSLIPRRPTRSVRPLCEKLRFRRGFADRSAACIPVPVGSVQRAPAAEPFQPFREPICL